MRLAVLADVHGNLPTLEAALAEIAQLDVDGFILAGDYITGGPQPVQVARRLRSLTGWAIRGNGEDYLLAYHQENGPEVWGHSRQWATLRWSYRQVDREAMDWIAGLPEQRVIELPGVAPIRVVHGSLEGPTGQLYPDRDPVKLKLFRQAALLLPDQEPPKLEKTLAQIAEPVLVCAHTHIPWQQEHGGKLALNPGSVSAPLDGDTRAQYALLTWQNGRWRAEHRAAPYDLTQVRAAYTQSGLLAQGDAFARACLRGIETGQNVPGYFVSHFYRLAAEAGYEESGDIPDVLWDQAVATFDW